MTKKKKIKIIIIIGILCLSLLVGGISYYFYNLKSVSNKSEKVTFVIKKGMSSKAIITDLKDAKIIKDKFVSLVYLKLHRNIILKAGKFELNRNMTTPKIFNKLSFGDSIKDVVKLTFIEGKRNKDYFKQIADTFNYQEEDIIKEINNQEYLNKLIKKYDFLTFKILNSDIYYPLEGYLFPDTYEFYKDESIKSIIEKMLAKTKEVLDNYSTSLKRSQYDVHEILTMASIIENEAKFKEDRNIVSEVIYKRLSIKMNLGMDATTYYGVQKTFKDELTMNDLNNNNPYNTRVLSFKGLPVGPICNPSLSSIDAVFNPTNKGYVYFHSDENGKLHFAKTYEEFLILKNKY